MNKIELDAITEAIRSERNRHHAVEVLDAIDNTALEIAEGLVEVVEDFDLTDFMENCGAT